MNIPRLTYNSRRYFYHWLNIVWNRVDKGRIQHVGPDVACAEWLMRNGAFVKWVGHVDYLTDYNVLVSPVNKNEKRLIEEIDATDATIMHIGFPYFNGCKHIKLIKLEHCLNIEDRALNKLVILKDSLQHLQVLSCGNVTDEGVKSLVNLNNLKSLLLQDLPGVRDEDDCNKVLREGLPECQIDFRSFSG